MCQYL